jgi:DNA-binding NarL/FixJ family response regulator
VALYRQALEDGRPFAAVLMDLTVPGGLGGKEALGQLREIDPEVKAIVSSGYSYDPIMSDFRRYGFQGVVGKPYDLGRLSQALATLLGGETAGPGSQPAA